MRQAIRLHIESLRQHGNPARESHYTATIVDAATQDG